MRTLLAITCLAAAATSAWSVLLAFVRVLRGKKAGILRNGAALVLMVFALWQSYLLEPVPTAMIVYGCVPAAIAGALLIVLSGVPEMTSDEPGDGPERRVPAMALRVRQTQVEEEKLKVAMGARCAA
jgi:hypothetical protein